jgi:hypothetical protein
MATGAQDPIDFACRGVVKAQVDVSDADGTCHVCSQVIRRWIIHDATSMRTFPMTPASEARCASAVRSSG